MKSIIIKKHPIISGLKESLTNSDNVRVFINKNNGEVLYFSCPPNHKSNLIPIEEFLPEEYRSPIISSEQDFDYTGLKKYSDEYYKAQWEAYCNFVDEDLYNVISENLFTEIKVESHSYHITYI